MRGRGHVPPDTPFMEDVMRFLVLLFAAAVMPAAGSPIDYDVAASSVDAHVRAHYEQIHMNPELGKQETKTSAYITSQLKSFGYTTFYSVPALVFVSCFPSSGFM